jgi:hypothetical protein
MDTHFNNNYIGSGIPRSNYNSGLTSGLTSGSTYNQQFNNFKNNFQVDNESTFITGEYCETFSSADLLKIYNKKKEEEEKKKKKLSKTLSNYL